MACVAKRTKQQGIYLVSMYIVLCFDMNAIQGIFCTLFHYFFSAEYEMCYQPSHELKIKMYSVAELSELVEHITPNAQVGIWESGEKLRQTCDMSCVLVIPNEGWTVLIYLFIVFFFCKSLSYQKKDGWVICPSFFWYDNDSGH